MSTQKYQVIIQRTVTEHWEVEAESASDAEMIYQSNGECVFSKENAYDVLDIDKV